MRSGQAKTPTDQKSRPALGEGLVQVLFLVGSHGRDDRMALLSLSRADFGRGLALGVSLMSADARHSRPQDWLERRPLSSSISRVLGFRRASPGLEHRHEWATQN